MSSCGPPRGSPTVRDARNRWVTARVVLSKSTHFVYKRCKGMLGGCIVRFAQKALEWLLRALNAQVQAKRYWHSWLHTGGVRRPSGRRAPTPWGESLEGRCLVHVSQIKRRNAGCGSGSHNRPAPPCRVSGLLGARTWCSSRFRHAGTLLPRQQLRAASSAAQADDSASCRGPVASPFLLMEYDVHALFIFNSSS